MAMSLRCIQHSQKLLQSMLFESCRQPIPCFNSPFVLKTCRYLCTKFVANEKELKDINLSKEIGDYFDENSKPATSDPDDLFGNMKISLENQKKMEKKGEMIPKARVWKNTKMRKNYLSKSGAPDESDTFGKLTDSSVWFTEVAEPEPGDLSTIFVPDKKYKSARTYLIEMKLLVKQKRLKEALELFPDMKRNGVFPLHANFTFMIGACGRAGYMEMAFKLLKQMTSRQMRPTPATLTGLFNSCAECPFPEQGLEQIVYLREKILEKNWLLSQLTYHAMIKAYGKCGDILASFQVVDEMVEAGIRVDVQTYAFLLMSCISDKEAGFTHAVEVWRIFIAKKHVPNIFCFNLLLRAARDCGVGPEETASLLLQHWSSYTKRPYGLNRTQIAAQNDMLKLANPELTMIKDSNLPSTKLIQSSDASPEGYYTHTNKSEKPPSTHELQCKPPEISANETTPRLLANVLVPRPMGCDFTDLLSVRTATDRIALLGCAEGFLGTMSRYKVKPNIKTFMLLLETLPRNTEDENVLISQLDAYGVKPDTDFFNILIKRRNLRKDFNSAKQVLLLIHKYHLTPDIVTFGVLALGCFKRKYGQQLLREIKQLGCHPNIEIMGALVHNASQSNDFEYLKDVLEAMKYQGIRPNEKILTKLEKTVETARKIIIDKEQGKDVPYIFSYESFNKQFYDFCNYYERWLKSVKVQIEDHPWDQFKTEIVKDNTVNHLLV